MIYPFKNHQVVYTLADITIWKLPSITNGLFLRCEESMYNILLTFPDDPGFELLSFLSQACCGITLLCVQYCESGVFAAGYMVNSRKEVK